MVFARMSLGDVLLRSHLWMCELSLTDTALHPTLLYLKDPTLEMSHVGKRHVPVDEVIIIQHGD